ncbi:Hypothetical predicted protein, partial [Paramuricea clavata]
YLFNSERDRIIGAVLTRRDLTGKELKISGGAQVWPEAMTLDYLNKRVIVLIRAGYFVSMDYDGGNRIEIPIDRSLYSGLFSEIGSSMYFRTEIAPIIVEMNVTSWDIFRYVRLVNGYPMKLIVVDKSLQPE